MSDSANVYQVNYHEGDGWQVVDEATIKERVGPSWEYMQWCFDQGKAASVRHVEYRRVAARPPQVSVEVERKGHTYFFSRYRGETPDVSRQPIPRDRAMQLVEFNPGGKMDSGDGADTAVGLAKPDFSSTPCDWVYTAVVQMEEVGK